MNARRDYWITGSVTWALCDVIYWIFIYKYMYLKILQKFLIPFSSWNIYLIWTKVRMRFQQTVEQWHTMNMMCSCWENAYVWRHYDILYKSRWFSFEKNIYFVIVTSYITQADFLFRKIIYMTTLWHNIYYMILHDQNVKVITQSVWRHVIPRKLKVKTISYYIIYDVIMTSYSMKKVEV